MDRLGVAETPIDSEGTGMGNTGGPWLQRQVFCSKPERNYIGMLESNVTQAELLNQGQHGSALWMPSAR